MAITLKDINNLLLPGFPHRFRLEKTKAEVRYRLYRKRKEAQDGVPYDLEEWIIDFFEEQEDFLGWENFAIYWDVHYEEGVWVTFIRDHSEYDEWNARVRKLTDVLPMKRKIKQQLKKSGNDGSES